VGVGLKFTEREPDEKISAASRLFIYTTKISPHFLPSRLMLFRGPAVRSCDPDGLVLVTNRYRFFDMKSSARSAEKANVWEHCHVY